MALAVGGLLCDPREWRYESADQIPTETVTPAAITHFTEYRTAALAMLVMKSRLS
jgi:hypothetical protein